MKVNIKKPAIVISALENKIRDLETVLDSYIRSDIRQTKPLAKIYNELFPEALDVPDGKGFKFDDNYLQIMIDEIRKLKGK